VTMGIVSATGRGELGIVAYEDFIQTDASINMGNSGGALVDSQGRLVGINTAILSGSGGNQGVGFAIPVNMARLIMERLVQHGKFTRGFLGVGLQPLTPELAESLELKDQAGALITGVEEGTPAAEAGLKPGDLIVEFNARKVADYRRLQLMVSQTSPGSKVNFKILRGGKARNVEVTLAEFPTERRLAGAPRRSVPEQSANELIKGVEVTSVDGRSRRQFGIPGHIQGALITSVDPGSTAAEAGLRPGDVILEMDRKTVANADDALELGRNFAGKKLLLRVWSQGGAKWVIVNLEQESDQPEKDQ
jgi:serine protease Do